MKDYNELYTKLVSIKRVAKVVKGGRRFSFGALVVAGDQNGRIGVGLGKAAEVMDARTKADFAAKAAMKTLKIPLREGRTLHHDVKGKYGAGKIYMRSAAPGTGIIAGGPVRAVCEGVGLKDVVVKSVGSSNPHNMVKAAIAALANVRSPKSIAAGRDLKVGEIISRRERATKTNERKFTNKEESASTKVETKKINIKNESKKI